MIKRFKKFIKKLAIRKFLLLKIKSNSLEIKSNDLE